MQILVTGGTGFIGSNLIEELIKQKHQVFALVRRTSKTDFLKSLNVELIYGDITDGLSLQQILTSKIDAVYHCAAYVADKNWEKLYQANVVGTENICKLCLKANVERLVYLSSVAVVSGHPDVPLIEDLPYSATNLYGRSKIEAEKIVIGYRNKGLKAAVIRPPMVYGEEEPHALGKILFLIKHRLLPIIGEGRAKWHLAYVKNVVNGLILALHKEEFLKDTFFVADEEILTVKEIFTILSQGINAPVPIVLPVWFNPILTNIPVIGKRLGFFLKDRVYDISRIKALGFSPHFTAQESLVRSAAYWLEKKQ